jgi:hypothetical protein
MSLASLRRVLGPRIALGGALLASACQHDSNAVFDDTKLPSTEPGSSGEGQGGSGAVAGESNAGRAGGGTGGKASAGGAGGKTSAAGAGGKTNAAGAGGKASAGGAGKAGAETGGSGGAAGKSGAGGAIAGMAGTGGTATDPGPMTFETRDIDDTDVQECSKNENFGVDDPLNPDGDNFCAIETLISIPLAGVPDGALVSDASLTLTCTDPGGAIVVSYVDETWSELKVTWNSRPNDGTIIDNIRCKDVGEVTIDLTTAVTAWLAGDHENFGIYLRTESTDGTDFASSEADNEAERPRLSVTYTLPVK